MCAHSIALCKVWLLVMLQPQQREQEEWEQMPGCECVWLPVCRRLSYKEISG